MDVGYEQTLDANAGLLFLASFVSVYVALTNIPEGELLTGFAMRSDPNVAFGFLALTNVSGGGFRYVVRRGWTAEEVASC